MVFVAPAAACPKKMECSNRRLLDVCPLTLSRQITRIPPNCATLMCGWWDAYVAQALGRGMPTRSSPKCGSHLGRYVYFPLRAPMAVPSEDSFARNRPPLPRD